MICGIRAPARLLAVCVFCASIVNAQICATPRNTRGNCVSLKTCPSLWNIFVMKAINEETRDYLQRSRCGYDMVPKVCCETDADACKTPNGEPGVCATLRTCPNLVDILQSKPFLTDDIVQYFRDSECKGDAKLKLCCPFIKRDIRAGLQERNLLPDDCGTQSFTNKIKGGNVTDIYQYPWMALLEYDGIEGTELSCGGTLINERYVMTAAHCLNQPGRKLTRVRLGEYDTNNVTDCKYFPFGGSDCMDPIVQVDIEEIIPHESFNREDRRHDIALLRLADTVAVTDFVRPICIPNTKLDLPNKMIVAGWGNTEIEIPSPVKLELQVPLFPQDTCVDLYGRSKITVGAEQICAGGEFGRDSCGGDSGGPLMTPIQSSTGITWMQVGIVSFGPTPCAREGVPAVYTLVSEYYEWIRGKLRA